MNGIIVVDKPSGMTSAQVVAQVKRLLRVKKVGHTGTLDPFATGVLVCCIDKATRLARFLTCGRKRYEGVLMLGIRTDTQDLTGQVVSTEHNLTVTDQDVRRVFIDFLDVKQQTPPAYSALKHCGVPLYKLARRGTFVQKPARRISIYMLEVLDISLPHVRFEVCCSAGTYVRTLCADIGEKLGCGAHLTRLCRTESGRFTLNEAVSLNTLKKHATTGRISKHIIPMSAALRGMPGISADDRLVQKIQHGHSVTQEEVLGSHLRRDCPSIQSETQGKIAPTNHDSDPLTRWIKVTDTKGNLIAVMSSSKTNGVYPYACVFPSGS